MPVAFGVVTDSVRPEDILTKRDTHPTGHASPKGGKMDLGRSELVSWNKATSL